MLSPPVPLLMIAKSRASDFRKVPLKYPLLGGTLWLLLGVLPGGDVSLHKVEIHTVVGLLGLGGVLLLLLNDQLKVGMLGNLLGQFLIDGAKTLACLVKTGLGADDLLVDEVDGETDGAGGSLLHNVSFPVPFGTVAFIREPYPLII